MQMSEGEEAVKEVKTFLEKAKPDLIISDVPRETLRIFKEFANSDEFACGDNKGGHYGFALKFLLDYYFGRVPNGVQELAEEVELLHEKINERKEEVAKPIKTVSGNILRIGG
jgi:hypothetical protein